MNNFFKKVILLLSIFILSIFVLSGCSKNNEVQPLIKNYEKLLNEGNYEALYDNISKKSKEYISKEEFIKRYSSIYSGIGANDIKISIGEINSKTQIPISITMNTLAGKLKFEDIKVDIVKEDKNYKIIWNESLILPPMTKDDKIGVEVDKAVRGQILDRDNNKLAYDGKAYQVNIHPSVFTANKDENLPKFAEVLDVSMDKISEKIEVKREIKTMIAAKKMESRIMNIIPLLIIVYFWLTSPGFLDCLYTVSGHIFMTGLFGIYMFGCMLSEKISDIKI